MIEVKLIGCKEGGMEPGFLLFSVTVVVSYIFMFSCITWHLCFSSAELLRSAKNGFADLILAALTIR